MGKGKLEHVIIYHNNGNIFGDVYANRGSDLHKVANVAKILKENHGWSKKKIGSILKPSLPVHVISSKSFADLLNGLTAADVFKIVRRYVNKNRDTIIEEITPFA